MDSITNDSEKSTPVVPLHVPREGVEAVPLAQIRRDGGTQVREKIIQHVVNTYAEQIDVLPPVSLFFDGTQYWLADGFHRVEAAEKAGRTEIQAFICEGDQRAAVLFSVGANIRHGLRRSNKDKKRAVLLLLSDQEWAGNSDRWIAEKCGVSDPFVGRLRKRLQTVSTSSERKGRDGKKRKLKVRTHWKCECGAKLPFGAICEACFDEKKEAARIVENVDHSLKRWPTSRSLDIAIAALETKLAELKARKAAA